MQDPELIANVSLLLLVEVLEAIVGMGVKYFISFDMHDLRDGLMQHHMSRGDARGIKYLSTPALVRM